MSRPEGRFISLEIQKPLENLLFGKISAIIRNKRFKQKVKNVVVENDTVRTMYVHKFCAI